jgi:hypothetical protein
VRCGFAGKRHGDIARGAAEVSVRGEGNTAEQMGVSTICSAVEYADVLLAHG